MSFNFNSPAGQTIDRKLYLCCGNSGTYEAPNWGRLGKRVEDSSAENDWGEETKQDILGDTYTTMKTPVISQTFDPCELDSGDEYQHHVWELAVVKPSGLGGAGGGSLTMPIDITFGGKREVGTASVAADGTITFTKKGTVDSE